MIQIFSFIGILVCVWIVSDLFTKKSSLRDSFQEDIVIPKISMTSLHQEVKGNGIYFSQFYGLTDLENKSEFTITLLFLPWSKSNGIIYSEAVKGKKDLHLEKYLTIYFELQKTGTESKIKFEDINVFDGFYVNESNILKFETGDFNVGLCFEGKLVREHLIVDIYSKVYNYMIGAYDTNKIASDVRFIFKSF